MKIGCIGAGNMVTGMIKGWLASQTIASHDIAVTASTYQNAQKKASELGVNCFQTNEELIAHSDIIIFGIHPQHLTHLLFELPKSLFTNDKLFLSIAAGLTLSEISSQTVPDIKLTRMMPNMNIAIQQSVSGICFATSMTKKEQATILALIDCLGNHYILSEADFVTFTALAGCSPAFTALYVDGLSRAGVAHGLPLDQSREIVLDAMIGTLQNLKTSQLTPWDLINQVCSPGGTTIQGVASLEKDGLTTSLFNAVSATITKDQELSQ